MFKFRFYIFSAQAVVASHRDPKYVLFHLDDTILCTDPDTMSLREFREIYGSCSVVGCDHLTLGDYLPIA